MTDPIRPLFNTGEPLHFNTMREQSFRSWCMEGAEGLLFYWIYKRIEYEVLAARQPTDLAGGWIGNDAPMWYSDNMNL